MLLRPLSAVIGRFPRAVGRDQVSWDPTESVARSAVEVLTEEVRDERRPLQERAELAARVLAPDDLRDRLPEGLDNYTQAWAQAQLNLAAHTGTGQRLIRASLAALAESHAADVILDQLGGTYVVKVEEADYQGRPRIIDTGPNFEVRDPATGRSITIGVRVIDQIRSAHSLRQGLDDVDARVKASSAAGTPLFLQLAVVPRETPSEVRKTIREAVGSGASPFLAFLDVEAHDTEPPLQVVVSRLMQLTASATG